MIFERRLCLSWFLFTLVFHFWCLSFSNYLIYWNLSQKNSYSLSYELIIRIFICVHKQCFPLDCFSPTYYIDFLIKKIKLRNIDFLVIYIDLLWVKMEIDFNIHIIMNWIRNFFITIVKNSEMILCVCKLFPQSTYSTKCFFNQISSTDIFYVIMSFWNTHLLLFALTSSVMSGRNYSHNLFTHSTLFENSSDVLLW